MRKLIYLTGQIDSPFLCNEIDQFRKHFDEVLVVAYDDDIKSCDALSKRYDFKYLLISSVGRGFGVMVNLLAWSRQPYVKQELGLHSRFGMKALKKEGLCLSIWALRCKAEKAAGGVCEAGGRVVCLFFLAQQAGLWQCADFQLVREQC